jgi:hypothetical protein
MTVVGYMHSDVALQRITSSLSLASKRAKVTESGSLVTLPPVAPPVHPRYSLFTPLTMPVRVLRTMPSQLRAEAPVSLMVSLTFTRKLWPRMALLVFIVVSFLQSSASLCTVVSILVFMTRLVRPVHCFTPFPKPDLVYRTRCPCWCTRWFIPCILLTRLGCYYWCRSCLIPFGHYSSSYDDDLWIYHTL